MLENTFWRNKQTDDLIVEIVEQNQQFGFVWNKTSQQISEFGTLATHVVQQVSEEVGAAWQGSGLKPMLQRWPIVS